VHHRTSTAAARAIRAWPTSAAGHRRGQPLVSR